MTGAAPRIGGASYFTDAAARKPAMGNRPTVSSALTSPPALRAELRPRGFAVEMVIYAEGDGVGGERNFRFAVEG